MEFDVVIVGGGLAGASLAAALAGSRTRVALIERRAPPPPGAQWDSRVYTLTPASIAFLEGINAWQGVPAERLTPIYDMQVFGDEGSRLDFSAYESGLRELGATVESGRVNHALWRGLERQRNLSLICPGVPLEMRRGEGWVELRLDLARSIRAKLVVGADGAESWVRSAAGLDARSESYDQLGVVANFACERSHRNVAFQWFRRDGILAFLPLPERRVSMVWSTPAVREAAETRESRPFGTTERRRCGATARKQSWRRPRADRSSRSAHRGPPPSAPRIRRRLRPPPASP